MKLILVSLFLFIAVPTFAQTATARQRVAWDQDVTGTGAVLADVQQFAYKAYIDGATVGVPLQNVVCIAGGTAADPFVCSAAWPLLPLGPHVIAVSAANGTGESLPSTPFSFTFQVVIPNVPKKVRIA